ncbi:MAG: DUF58 domain-containing protein [Actinobacteria bacterium]|nr:DUF58 domain-containing protein [Actinomycetota bacterium]
MSPVLRLAPSRSAARPGPGPLSQPLLRALDIELRRRIDGLLAGDYRASLLGSGTELAQVRRYEPGDDVRNLEWNVTARTGEPHVRVHVAEKALTTWLLLDVSPSMSFGTADRRKADVAEGVALAIGHLSTRRGNRVGLVPFGNPSLNPTPAIGGRAGMLGLLTALRAEPPAEGGGRTTLAEAFRRAAGIARGRAAILVVSDFRGEDDWRRPLLQLTHRHEVVAVEIQDPRELELPDVGDLWLVDPETGRQVRADTRDRSLRERFSAAAAEEREGARMAILGAGAHHVVLSTSGDWLRHFAAFLSQRRAFR